MKSDPNMKLLLFTGRILNIRNNKSHYVTKVYLINEKQSKAKQSTGKQSKAKQRGR